MSNYELDLRGVACPMNFVKTKLFLDKMRPGDRLVVLLDAGEPVESVSSSVEAEGHRVEQMQELPDGHFSVAIRKSACESSGGLC
jgi:TusA-related sulfurtransferase